MNKCIHKWKVLAESYTESPLERQIKLGMSSIKNYPSDYGMGTKIIILQCTVCGQLDKTIEKV